MILGISLENSWLTTKQKDDLLELIGHHRKSFAKTDLVQHTSHLGDAKLFSRPTPEQH